MPFIHAIYLSVLITQAFLKPFLLYIICKSELYASPGRIVCN